MARALGLKCVKGGDGRQCLQHAESEQRGTEGREGRGVRCKGLPKHAPSQSHVRWNL